MDLNAPTESACSIVTMGISCFVFEIGTVGRTTERRDVDNHRKGKADDQRSVQR